MVVISRRCKLTLQAHHFVSRKTGLEPVFLIVEIELEWKNVVAATLLQSNDLASFFRVGRSANAGAFGKAWDAWQRIPAIVGAGLRGTAQKQAGARFLRRISCSSRNS
jgi:hypothetical protein